MEIELIQDTKLICVKYEISKKQLEYLKNKTNDILKNEKEHHEFNSNLAGNIEKEYKLKDDKNVLTPILSKLSNTYYENFDDKKYVKNLKWKIDGNMWVNFQKKYEYNPLHNHTGILSFVLWVQIPYDLEEELSLPNCKKSNLPKNSLFEFICTNYEGKIVSYPIQVDKTYEGTIIVFPSTLNHIVYPFYTSDEYRISISGNLVPDFENNRLKYQYQ